MLNSSHFILIPGDGQEVEEQKNFETKLIKLKLKGRKGEAKQ